MTVKTETLSVVINTKNSAQTLSKTLESVQFADEIIVVDMNSSDDTLKIAKKFTKNCFSHQDVGYVEPARAFALSKAKQDWILVIDSDEIVPDTLKLLIQDILAGKAGELLQADCYYLPRKNIIFKKWIQHSGWWPDYVLRLFRRDYVTWGEELHAIPKTRGIVREFPAKENCALEHDNYQTISQFIDRMNRYTTIQAREITQENQKAPFVSESVIWERFEQEFFSRFFYSQGYLDGTHGMVLSLLQACSEVAKLSKTWEHQSFPTQNSPDDTMENFQHFQKKLSYWIADYHVRNGSGMSLLWWRLKRKFATI